jgi:hypothetical protein
MRQPRPLLVSDRERISELERRVDEHDGMKQQVQEMHDLLFGARAILWFIGKVLAWIGGPSAIAAVGYAAWRTFTGH